MVVKATGNNFKTTGLDDENSILPDEIESPAPYALDGYDVCDDLSIDSNNVYIPSVLSVPLPNKQNCNGKSQEDNQPHLQTSVWHLYTKLIPC